ncbi:MAG: M67 family metallopeptidase [Gemmatimonadetes bacterium]|nr:M67 family metallopeptidase [Gemmatimonadota bacterium]
MLKRLIIPHGAAGAAATAAREGYPFEICGALAGRFEAEEARVARIVPLPNSAEESQRRRRFTIDPVLIVRLDRELRRSGESLVGFYHSHPDHEAAPSATDLEFFRLWPETVWLIIPVKSGEPGLVRAWWLASDAEKATELEVVSGA